MTKQDYLIKKGLIPDPTNGTLWVVKSTRTSVIMFEVPVSEVKKQSGNVTYYDDSGNVTRKSTQSNFRLNGQEPYEIDIDDETKIGEKHGYGTGVGDLWGWSYFASPDKAIAEKLYEDEKLRVQTKYLLIF